MKRENSINDLNQLKRCFGLLDENGFALSIFSKLFENNSFDKDMNSEMFDKSISTLTEDSSKQKDNGIYYTPQDVCDYITYNTVHSLYCEEKHGFSSCKDLYKWFLNNTNTIESFIFEKKILDPTSGAGEFLVSIFKLKLLLFRHNKQKPTISDIRRILLTIHGNDIDKDANTVSKIRILLQIYFAFGFCDDSFVSILNNNFTCLDFLETDDSVFGSYDLIIGNPPYVEKKNKSKYGNIYADVLEKAHCILNAGGTFGFIIPISYVSTTRMKLIRKIIEKSFSKQLIANYADRPSSLFKKAHQKVSILICSDNKDHGIYVSKYRYFYKNERNKVFGNINMIKLEDEYDFYPKIGSQAELKIITKILNLSTHNLVNLLDEKGEPVYLNMRGYFWNKAFTYSPGSSEYKKFGYPAVLRDYITCILNSSLFWFFWVCVSDCWHITSKELKLFSVPVPSDAEMCDFSTLCHNLLKELENKKEYIGSVQTQYVYKHKYCKDIIDKIDDTLGRLYKLTDSELLLVKNYALKYRMGNGNE